MLHAKLALFQGFQWWDVATVASLHCIITGPPYPCVGNSLPCQLAMPVHSSTKTQVCVQAAFVGIPSPNILPGVRVPEVLRQSIAEKAGLKRGDIITRIAGVDIPAEPRSVSNVVSIIT